MIDLIAVLCPYGPLRMMIEATQENNQELPAALIYTAMIWMMATPPSSPRSPVLVQVDHQVATSVAALLDNPQSSNDLTSRMEARNLTQEIELNDMGAQDATITPRRERQEEEEEEEEGLKLGLGDFVFYSVLVGRASLNDWITTVGTMLAVISGLIITIFILVLTRKPLPALPISIFFGILIYLVGSLTLVPLVQSLMTANVYPSAGLRNLIAGSQGLGFLYL